MRVYRTLQRLLLPPSFRREFGEEMARAVAARLAAAGGGARRWTILAREAADLVATGAREWAAVLTEGVGTSRERDGGDGIMQELARDIRYGIRTLLRTPVLSAVVVATLALGIGANTAIYSVVDAVLLEGLPYPEPDRLVNVWQDVTERGGPDTEWFNYEDFADLEAEPGLLKAAGTWNFWQPTLVAGSEPEVVSGMTVSHGFLGPVFGARPALGRLFDAGDDRPGAPGVVVLSHRVWMERFGGDPEVVGRTFSFSEVPHTVVGVLEPGFTVPMAPDAGYYQALGVLGELQCVRGCYGVRAVGRLADGLPLEQARARARALAARLEAAYPDTNTNMSFNVVGMQRDLTREAAPALWVLLGAVAFVLLIACTNVANLLLARGAAREGELAVRRALGAGRGRLFRQLLTESLLLAVVGGAGGVLLAAWGTDLLLAAAPDGALPRVEGVGLDGRVLAVSAAVTLLTGLLFGLVPAWRSSRGGVQEALRATGRGTAGGGRLRDGLAVLQVALALVLLVGAGLLVRSFDRLHDAELGFDPEGVLAVQMALPGTRYQERQQIQDFYYTLLERVGALPEVQAVGAVNSLPLAGLDSDASFVVEGEAPAATGISQAAWIRPVSEGYFDAAGLELLEGRNFAPGDDAEADRVVIVNQTMADRYFDGGALGRRMAFGRDPSDANWRTVVGVARDVRHFGLREPPRPAVYLPYRQVTFAQMAVVVRTSGDPTALAPAVRRVVAELDPALAASNLRPLQELVDRALAPDRFVTFLLTVFALAALLLAAVGIYGVLSYGVTRRYREMGIRMALGADAAQVRRLVVRGGVALVGLGLLLGLLGAGALTRLLGTLLYQVEATDPVTFAATTALLAAVGFLACWIPALRAGRTRPMTVLREE